MRDTDKIHSNKFHYRYGVQHRGQRNGDRKGLRRKPPGEHSNVYVTGSGTSAQIKAIKVLEGRCGVSCSVLLSPYLPKHWLKKRL